MKVWAVIPAFEAERSVGEVVQQVRPFASQVVVVDDGSSDATAQVAAAAGALVLRHVINRGYGAALLTGSDYALQHGAEAVVHFDADGQFEAADIPKLVAALTPGRPAAALGSRFLGKAIGMSWFRGLTLQVATVFTWLVSGVKLTDAHNGLRALTKEAWQQCEFHQDRMAFSSEVIDEIIRHRIPWVEVPVMVRYTDYSRQSSQQGRLPSLKIVRDIMLGKILH